MEFLMKNFDRNDITDHMKCCEDGEGGLKLSPPGKGSQRRGRYVTSQDNNGSVQRGLGDVHRERSIYDPTARQAKDEISRIATAFVLSFSGVDTKRASGASRTRC